MRNISFSISKASENNTVLAMVQDKVNKVAEQYNKHPEKRDNEYVFKIAGFRHYQRYSFSSMTILAVFIGETNSWRIKIEAGYRTITKDVDSCLFPAEQICTLVKEILLMVFDLVNRGFLNSSGRETTISFASRADLLDEKIREKDGWRAYMYQKYLTLGISLGFIDEWVEKRNLELKKEYGESIEKEKTNKAANDILSRIDEAFSNNTKIVFDGKAEYPILENFDKGDVSEVVEDCLMKRGYRFDKENKVWVIVDNLGDYEKRRYFKSEWEIKTILEQLYNELINNKEYSLSEEWSIRCYMPNTVHYQNYEIGASINYKGNHVETVLPTNYFNGIVNLFRGVDIINQMAKDIKETIEHYHKQEA